MKKLLILCTSLGLAACVNTPSDVNGTMGFFDFDSAKISDQTKTELVDVANYMKRNPDTKIVIEGHCDERGSTEYNLALGALRAGNAKHVLVKERIEPERVKTISYGKENPQFSGTGEEVWRKNRNVTIRID